MYSGITSGRVLDGELLYTKILEFDIYHQGHISVLADYQYFLGVCAIEIYTCMIYKMH